MQPNVNRQRGLELLEICFDTFCQYGLENTGLKKLAESIRYSDPMSTPAIEDVEQRIHMTINELRVYCEQGDKPSALEAISRLDLMLVERNKKLMLSK